MEKISAIKAIKTYFEQGPSGRKVTMSELKELTTEERKHLGQLSAEALGMELQ
jgi:hypothetical protein